MRTRATRGLALLSIALGICLAATDKAEKDFRPGSPQDYPHQTNNKVTVGAQKFDSPDQTAKIFGKKADLNRYGILPVLVVVQNYRAQTLDLHDIVVRLEMSDGQHLEAIPAAEVPFIDAPGQRYSLGRNPGIKRKKNPLNVPEIATWAFTAPILPAGDKASGFFYFQCRPETGMRVYVTGMVERPSGKEIVYFEIPL